MAYQPRHQLAPGPQLVAVILGAQHCGPCNVDTFKSSVQSLGALLRHQAAARSATLHLVAAALDWDVAVGLAYLQELGEFDEVAAGGSWTSSAAVRYIWHAPSAPPSIPQVLVFERTVSMVDGRLAFDEERELARLVGAAEIQHWIAKGASLPKDGAPA